MPNENRAGIYNIKIVIRINKQFAIGVEGLEPTNFRSQTEHFTIKLHPVSILVFTFHQNRTDIYRS